MEDVVSDELRQRIERVLTFPIGRSEGEEPANDSCSTNGPAAHTRYIHKNVRSPQEPAGETVCVGLGGRHIYCLLTCTHLLTYLMISNTVIKMEVR